MRMLYPAKYQYDLLVFVVLLCTILLSGCDSLINDLDEDKLPKTVSKLSVACYISPQSARYEAIITESRPLLGPAEYDTLFVSDADVFLSDGTSRIQLIYNDSTFKYVADTSTFKVAAGKTYTLTVADGERFVKAQCTVPAKVATITDFVYEKIPDVFSVRDSVSVIRFSWKDIPNETNFYAIYASATTSIITLNYNPVTQENYPDKYLYTQRLLYGKETYNDINLDGITFKSPELRIFVPNRYILSYVDRNGETKTYDNEAHLKEIRAEVLSIDEHYYKFYRSLSNNNDGNPFIEPTLIYTNVEGGLGCFASYNAAVAIINPK